MGQLRNHGPIEARLAARLTPVPEAGCWLWEASTDAFGYGYIKHNGRMRKTHRVAWELAHGPIPDGLCVLHRCDTPTCCNPEHLFLGTIQDNNTDKQHKGRAKGISRNKGTGNPSAKLTEANVSAIRADKRPQEVIAAEFGVSRRAVGMLLRGQTWGHVA